MLYFPIRNENFIELNKINMVWALSRILHLKYKEDRLSGIKTYNWIFPFIFSFVFLHVLGTCNKKKNERKKNLFYNEYLHLNL